MSNKIHVRCLCRGKQRRDKEEEEGMQSGQGEKIDERVQRERGWGGEKKNESGEVKHAGECGKEEGKKGVQRGGKVRRLSIKESKEEGEKAAKM